MRFMIVQLALKSLANRRMSALFTILAVALSVCLFLGVEKVRTGARASFEMTISDTDLIVGARSSSINLLLYTVFRIGDPTGGVSWESYEQIANAPGVAWTVPLSLGDSHRGYRVIGTTEAYLERYKYAGDQSLRLSQGVWFVEPDEVVLGAEVARALEYGLGQEIVLAHGVGAVSFAEHDNYPFRIVGILAPTGTPVDRSVHVSLEGLDAMHGLVEAHEDEDEHDHSHEPQQISAFLLGMDSPVQILRLQRQINTYPAEALSAVIPGVALSQLWTVIGAGERALQAISVFVVLVGLISVLTSLSSSVNERRREMSILRAVGARPAHVFGLIVSETLILSLAGALGGFVIVHTLLMGLTGWVASQYGLSVQLAGPGLMDAVTIVGVTIAGGVMGLLPAWRSLRLSLTDGLSIRL